MAAKEVMHLGTEFDSCELAEKLLRKGHTVTFVGLGESMEPLIRDETRMTFKPCNTAAMRAKITPGMPVFSRITKRGKGRWGDEFEFDLYACHMVWMVSGNNVLIGSSGGNLDGWTPKEQVIGIYTGPWEGEVTKVALAE